MTRTPPCTSCSTTRASSRSSRANTRSTSPMRSPMSRATASTRSEEHTSELQSQSNLVCRLLLEKKKKRPLDIEHRSRPDQRDETLHEASDASQGQFVSGELQHDSARTK